MELGTDERGGVGAEPREIRPSARRIELMTVVRCPMNARCHPDKPPLGLGVYAVSIVGRPAYPQPEVFHTVLDLRLARAAVPYYARLEIS